MKYRVASWVVAALGAALLAGLSGCGRESEDAGAAPGREDGDPSGAEPERIAALPLGHDLGNTEAPVTVTEFSDFGCPYCALFARESYPELREEFVDSGRVRWKYVPISVGGFPNGTEAALVAECAAEQDAFWAMREQLYADQERWKADAEPEPLWREYAEGAGLGVDEFNTCYESGELAGRTEQANRLAAQLQIRGTPTFFIEDTRFGGNGVRVDGVPAPDRFRSFLAELTAS